MLIFEQSAGQESAGLLGVRGPVTALLNWNSPIFVLFRV
jgi:hypothetical protein